MHTGVTSTVKISAAASLRSAAIKLATSKALAISVGAFNRSIIKVLFHSSATQGKANLSIQVQGLEERKVHPGVYCWNSFLNYSQYFLSLTSTDLNVTTAGLPWWKKGQSATHHCLSHHLHQLLALFQIQKSTCSHGTWLQGSTISQSFTVEIRPLPWERGQQTVFLKQSNLRTKGVQKMS